MAVPDLYRVDSVIKILRKQKKLTQVQLSEGICTRDQLSRIERGERMPDWYTFYLLMHKLGEDPSKFYKSVATQKDIRLEELKEEISIYIRNQQYETAINRIKEIENDEVYSDPIYRQFVLGVKAQHLIGIKQNPQQALDMLIEALRITRPYFNEEDIDKYILTRYEIMILNSVAIARCELSGIEKATELFFKLKKSLENTYIGDAGKLDTYRILLSNIAKNLRLMGKLEYCIEICDKAIELSHKYTDMNLYPKLLVHKGSCLHSLGRKDEALELFELACHVYIGINSNNLLSVNYYLKNDLGVVIDWVEQHINKNLSSN